MFSPELCIEPSDLDQGMRGAEVSGAIQERQRLALKLALTGFEPRHVAQLCDMQVQDVHALVKLYRTAGWAGIVETHGTTRSQRRKFTIDQEEGICHILGSYPEDHGFDAVLWDGSMAHSAIQQLTGVAVSKSAMKVYLKRWGFSPGRALLRAYSKDPEVVRYWMKRVYPSIASQARNGNAEVLWMEASVLRNGSHGTEKILLAMANNKGQNKWLVTGSPIGETSVLDLFQRTIHQRTRGIYMIASPDLKTQQPGIQHWLSQHRGVIKQVVTPAFLGAGNTHEEPTY